MIVTLLETNQQPDPTRRVSLAESSKLYMRGVETYLRSVEVLSPGVFHLCPGRDLHVRQGERGSLIAEHVEPMLLFDGGSSCL